MDLHTDFSQPELLALGGAVVTVVAAFLPWISGVEAGPVEIGATQTGLEGMGLLTLVLGILAVGAIVVLGGEATGAAVTAVLGLVVMAIGLWKLVDLGEAVSPGIGLYLTVLGGLGMLIGGALAHRSTGSGTEAVP